jgi:hypothetical protein
MVVHMGLNGVLARLGLFLLTYCCGVGVSSLVLGAAGGQPAVGGGGIRR